jgi:putative endonuclease
MTAGNRRGQQAEELARRHLEGQGLRLIARNFRSRFGEIDLVMRDRDELVFVEVRLRGQGSLLAAAESVDRRKQTRLSATALHFFQCHPGLAQTPSRFDVVAISDRNADSSIAWIKDAFGVGS